MCSDNYTCMIFGIVMLNRVVVQNHTQHSDFLLLPCRWTIDHIYKICSIK